MKNTYVENWQSIKDNFEKWWNREKTDKPLMWITAAGKKPGAGILPPAEPTSPRDKHMNVSKLLGSYRHFCETHYFLANAFPNASVNLGPGSMALYLGGEPEFAWHTVWYREKCASPREFKNLGYDENNQWWVTHQKMMSDAIKLADNDFYVGIPDIIENLDILSALRGPQNLCFDVTDDPDAVSEGVQIIDKYYFDYYDRCYDLLKDTDNSCVYTAFNIIGKSRVAKVQCDFNALISPQMFREFVVPSLTKQCKNLDHSVFHLDGPDAIKHVPALMEIVDLDALQWTCGAGKPDGACPDWYPIYDKVRDAGKGLWISIADGDPDDWRRNAKKIVERYGPTGLYLLFPVFPDLESAKKTAGLFG